MTDMQPGPLAHSRLAEFLQLVDDTHPVNAWALDLVEDMMERKDGGVALSPLGTQTLRALECYREAGEPEELGYHHVPGGYVDRSAIWPRVRSEAQNDWWMVEVVDLPGVGPNVLVDVRGWDCDLLAVAAALQAASRLAEKWRAEREAKEDANHAD